MQAFAAERRHLAGRVAGVLSRPGVFRLYGVALALGGAFVLVSGLYNVLVVVGVVDGLSGYELYLEEYRSRRLLHGLLFSAVLVGWLLIPAGFAGLPTLVRGRVWRDMARWGVLLCGGSAVVVFLAVAYRYANPYLTPFYAPDGYPDAYLYLGTLAGWFVGLLLLGVASLRVRGLGRWRVLPLVLAVLGSPASQLLQQPLASLVLPPPDYLNVGVPVAAEMIFWGPQMLAGLGWMAIAVPFARASSRERELVAAENLALAERLYAEAWAAGNLSVVDEICAPDCVDRYGDGLGPQSLKRSIVRMRNTFPDLRFVVEAQEAGDDETITRWTASGTDRGGVLWHPPTGNPATFGGRFTDRFAGGELIEHHGEADTARLLQQLGLPAAGEETRQDAVLDR